MKQFYVQEQKTPTPVPTKTPFASTALGVAFNTVRGIPRALVNTGKELVHSATRAVGSFGLGLAEPFTGEEEISKQNIKSPVLKKAFSFAFGDEPIQSVSRRVADNEIKIKDSPLAKKIGVSKFAAPLAFAGVVGGDALNFAPFGGESKLVTQLVKETDAKVIASVLVKMGVKSELIPRAAEALAAATKPAEVKDILLNTKAFHGLSVAAEKEAANAGEKVLETPAVTQPTKLSREGVPMALSAREKSIVEGAPKALEPTPKVSSPLPEGVRSVQDLAQERLAKANLGENSAGASLERIVDKTATPVNKKVGLHDYFRTPERVLKKIGLWAESQDLRTQYDGYLKELSGNINKVTQWSKMVPKSSNPRIFKWLDGQDIQLNDTELKVGNEIKTWLGEWADRLGLPKDERIGHYITHIFDDQLIKKEFDEDLAKIIRDQVPGSVYDPFLQKRLGAQGYVEDTWKALDAYVKRGTRKVYMDPVLEKLSTKADHLEESQWDYVKKYIDHVNMRPTKFDNWLDNSIKQMIGYRLGQRPTSVITKFLRQMTYRGMLGGNISSALKNLSQGINTYAKLGEKYTTIGYAKLLSPANHKELLEQGVLGQGFVEDRVLSSGKRALQRLDNVLFSFFEGAERINRGAAYFGGKAKALKSGATEEEAIAFGKKMVRDTQFTFGSIDTPVAFQGDIAKTLLQFQSYTTKQVEFLSEMAKNKEVAGLLRYAVGGVLFIQTIGQAFGMRPKDLIPIWRIGTPASLKLPTEIVKAAVGAPNKYGKERDLKTKISDIANSAVGLIPAGTQIKKTIQGVTAAKKGWSVDKAGRKQFKVGGTPAKDIQAALFGKYVTKESRDYFNPPKKGKKGKLKTFHVK